MKISKDREKYERKKKGIFGRRDRQGRKTRREDINSLQNITIRERNTGRKNKGVENRYKDERGGDKKKRRDRKTILWLRKVLF